MQTMLKSLRRQINYKGELFASTFTYGASAIFRLGSSLVLTRLLTPEAYGIVGILFSFLFIIELVSDVGSTGLLIRHPRGNDPAFIHTIWTIRLIRSVINSLIIFFGAPIAASIYHLPELINPLRLISVMFLLAGGESMAYVLAQRDQKSRISNYADMLSNGAMTIVTIGLAFVTRDHYALILGTIFRRALITISSYFFYRNVGVAIAFDREAIREQFSFARFVIPSSMLTVVLSQYDKILLLKLYNLSLVGVYTIAGNILSPASGVIVHNARSVLYPRISEYFRTDRSSARERYYSENSRLLLIGVLIPAVVAGFGNLFVQLLYDVRYAQAGHILMVLGLGAILSAFVNASENVLVASGKNHFVLVGNAVWLAGVIPASLLGYFTFGFEGFLWFNLIARVPTLIYFYYEQRRYRLLNIKHEFRLLGMSLCLFLLCLAISHLLLALLPQHYFHIRFHK